MIGQDHPEQVPRKKRAHQSKSPAFCDFRRQTVQKVKNWKDGFSSQSAGRSKTVLEAKLGRLAETIISLVSESPNYEDILFIMQNLDVVTRQKTEKPTTEEASKIKEAGTVFKEIMQELEKRGISSRTLP